MKRILCLISIFLMMTGFASTLFGSDTARLLIIDVRTVREWNNGHLEGAILIPYNQISEKIESVTKDKSQKIYVYCRTGRRSQIAKETLEKLGYKDVVNLGSLESAAQTLQRKIIK